MLSGPNKWINNERKNRYKAIREQASARASKRVSKYESKSAHEIAKWNSIRWWINFIIQMNFPIWTQCIYITNSSSSQWCNLNEATIWQLQKAMKSTAVAKSSIAKWALCDSWYATIGSISIGRKHSFYCWKPPNYDYFSFFFFAFLARHIASKWICTSRLWA